MLLATTNQICQQVAVVPFLWVLPLAIYLLSFVLCFDDQRWYRRSVFHPALGVAVFAALVVLTSPDVSITVQIVTYSMLLFAICMVCHGELYRLRPHEQYLTSFYLMVAVGGALGGLFVVLVAPWLFTGYWEFQLAIWTSLLMLFIVLMRDPASWIHERKPVPAIAMLSAAIVLPQLIGASFSASAMHRDSASPGPGLHRRWFDFRSSVSKGLAPGAAMARFDRAGVRRHGTGGSGRRFDCRCRGQSRR